MEGMMGSCYVLLLMEGSADSARQIGVYLFLRSNMRRRKNVSRTTWPPSPDAIPAMSEAMAVTIAPSAVSLRVPSAAPDADMDAVAVTVAAGAVAEPEPLADPATRLAVAVSVTAAASEFCTPSAVPAISEAVAVTVAAAASPLTAAVAVPAIRLAVAAIVVPAASEFCTPSAVPAVEMLAVAVSVAPAAVGLRTPDAVPAVETVAVAVIVTPSAVSSTATDALISDERAKTPPVPLHVARAVVSFVARHCVSSEAANDPLSNVLPCSAVSVQPVSGVAVLSGATLKKPCADAAPLLALPNAARVAVTVLAEPVMLLFVAD
jgi:hypothetical protein